MDEFALIERFFASAGVERPEVRLGVGDDAALVAPPPDHLAAIATDTIVSGVHFPPETDPAAIGHRALGVNLSDLAAMGATPAYALIALSLPRAESKWLAAFAEAFGALAHAHGVAIIGGDTTRSEVLTVTVTVVGWLAPGAVALTRSGARAGDLLAVSGTPGDAAAGLASLREGDTSAHARTLQQRFAFPAPRVACGQRLLGVATSAIDVSDGLLADGQKLAEASGARLVIEARSLPVSEALVQGHGRDGAEHFALTGGDDYELLFTLPRECEPALVAIASDAACPLSVIGEVVEVDGALGPGASVTRDGCAVALSTAGYRHFHA
ncbi:MAG: thiamine-phosphate kinase [Pseudomonadota bacterium]